MFHNLGTLQPTVERVLEQARETLHGALKRALDVEQLTQLQANSENQNSDGKLKGPGRVTMPAAGSTPAFRATLWANMEKLMEQIYGCCAQVQHLQKVLAKKRDPVTHICFLDELNLNRNSHLVQRFWSQVTTMLTLEFTRAANGTDPCDCASS